MIDAWPAILLGVATAAVATIVLARIAVRVSWTDDPANAPARKTQGRAVPAVGGAAILVALVATGLLDRTSLGPARALDPGWTAGAALLAFGLGLVDDTRKGGLRPLALLAGQSLVGAALLRAGFRLGLEPRELDLGLSLAAVVLALNVVNTFDNADGALATLAALSLSIAAPVLAAPFAGFLPFNLWIRDERRAPRAYLGNSGSLLAGVLLLAVPGAAAILLLPGLDLLRLAFVRVRRGGRPWVGDRRHLAHRLQAAGLSPTSVVLVLALLAAPALVPAWGAWGAAATAVLFVTALILTPALP